VEAVAPSLPAACADCTTTIKLADSASLPQKIGYKMSRAADGKLRIDYATTSVITDPNSDKLLLLDHIKKEARAIPIPKDAAPQLSPPHLPVPGMPSVPELPKPPDMNVKDLGKRLIEGHEVEGKQFTLPSPPTPPPLPGAPPLPALKPLIAEVWTSTELHIPVLTRITGPFGQQMCHCKNATAGEPPASAFQIPQDYKKIGFPQPPKPPSPPLPSR
jgi:hypothetical protein